MSSGPQANVRLMKESVKDSIHKGCRNHLEKQMKEEIVKGTLGREVNSGDVRNSSRNNLN